MPTNIEKLFSGNRPVCEFCKCRPVTHPSHSLCDICYSEINELPVYRGEDFTDLENFANIWHRKGPKKKKHIQRVQSFKKPCLDLSGHGRTNHGGIFYFKEGNEEC